MIRDYIHRVRQQLADILAVESEPTIDVQRMPDDGDSVLVFEIPDGLDDEEEEEYIDLIKSFRERGSIQSKILVIPSAINFSKVTE